MSARNALAIGGVVAVVGAAVYFAARERGEPEPEPPPAGPRWVGTHVFDFDLFIPEAWRHDYKKFGPHQVHFSLPEDDDFRPQLQIMWKKTSMTPAKWRDIGTSRFDDKKLSGGNATVAGMTAEWVIYEQKHTPVDGPERTFTTIDFYFAGRGHGGMLRGVATAPTFLVRYRELFKEVARRLRYRK